MNALFPQNILFYSAKDETHTLTTFEFSKTAADHFLFGGSSSDTNKAQSEVQVCFCLSLMIMMLKLNQAALLFTQLLVVWHVFAGTEYIYVFLSRSNTNIFLIIFFSFKQ